MRRNFSITSELAQLSTGHNMETEETIKRAETLLGFMSEREVYQHLVKEGIKNHDAFFAVMAAKILLKDKVA